MTGADAVVIGGGHNGLAMATALARSGVSVVVVEAEKLPGGMARTDDMLGCEHVHHPHATFLNYHAFMPLRTELQQAGLRWVVPEAQHAIVFADGRPGIVIHRRDLFDRTHVSVGRYSHADADLLVAVLSRAEYLRQSMADFLTSVPSRSMVQRYVAAIRRAYAGLPVLDGLGSRSVAGLILEFFRAPEVCSFLLMLAHELGGDVLEPGGDIGFLGVVCGLIADRAVPLAGMGSVVAAYSRVARQSGVEIQCDTTIDRISVSESAAMGVVTAAGREVTARRLVASTLPQAHTRALLENSRGPVIPEPGTMDAVKQHWVLSEPPRFISAHDEPAVAQAVQIFFGWDDPSAVVGRLSEIRRGGLPAGGGALLRPALADPSQSTVPECLLAIDSTFPDLRLLTDREQEVIRSGFSAAMARRLHDYAPNIGEQSILRSVVAPLRAVPRRIVIDRTGSAHYQLQGLERLYLAGADRHPGGGIHGACGWNAGSVALTDIAT